MSKKTGYSHINKTARPGGPCACGCGEIVSQPPGSGRPRKFIVGHQRPKTMERPCECGCGQLAIRLRAKGPVPRFIPGHKVKLVDPAASVAEEVTDEEPAVS